MQIHFTLNHKKTAAEIAPDTLLIDLVRSFRLQKRQARVRNRQLRAVHRVFGRKAGAFLLCTGGAGGWPQRYHAGGPAGGSR